MMKLLGVLEIDNKTDVLAFTAFLISVVTLSYTFKSFIEGADIMLFEPPSIVVAAAQYETDGPPYVVLISRFSYLNKGDKDYSAIVTSEKAKFRIGDQWIEHDWNAFVASTTAAGVFNLGGKIKPIFRDVAAPFVVAGGDSKSHETFLAPRTITCPSADAGCDENRNFAKLDSFISEFVPLMQEGGPKALPFEVTLTAETAGEGLLRDDAREEVKCVAMIRLQDIRSLQGERDPFFTRPCERQ
jgi:hypothetical protein